MIIILEQEGLTKVGVYIILEQEGLTKGLKRQVNTEKHTQQHIKKHIHPSLVKQSWQLRESPVPATVAAEIQTS